MELDVTLQLHTPAWKSKLRPYCKTVRHACHEALLGTRLAKLDGCFSMAVVLADDAFIRNLNHTYRSKDKPTNVLSFPAEEELERLAASRIKRDGQCELGDIIMAFETVEREAKEQGKRFADHATHLLVHGTLHLLGYDHEDDKQAAAMERREIKILKNLGVENPYL